MEPITNSNLAKPKRALLVQPTAKLKQDLIVQPRVNPKQAFPVQSTANNWLNIPETINW